MGYENNSSKHYKYQGDSFKKGSSNYVIQHNAQNVGETGKNSDEITTKIVIENQSCEKGIPFINET